MPSTIDPVFKRGQVASILGVDPQTIANREKSGVYPKAKRDLINNYRWYNLNDVLNLQIITFGSIDTRKILGVLYDMGYTDVKALGLLMEQALSRRKGEVNAPRTKS